ncbi:MAG: carboxypeptidase regulatory-like domain-containing protein [Bacteroidales bacterium]|nr:carboxypeptidase regulatory-like domain-containing protein [Candidatus Colimorpha onthohippi]
MRKILFALLSCMALATVWYGCSKNEDEGEQTGIIYGTVTDFATGEPVGDANVKLKPSGETTLTGSDGSFEFTGLTAGKYTLQLSKAGYNDLDDDYVIQLEAGKNVKRDVQMRKQIASLQVTDMAGNDIKELDLGSQESITSKSFNIYNNGTLNITCEITYACPWITSVSNITNPIKPGQTVTVTVTIDRTRLSGGENSTLLHIISNNGSNEIKVIATGPDLPTVTTAGVTKITASSATCGGNVIADGGSYVTERGICWATTNAPTTSNSHQAMGQGNGTFTCNMSNLEPNNVYYVRAYAINSKGTAYGEQKQFTTASGLPTVTINSVTNITATSATCGGSVSDNGGYAVTDKGLVWGTTQYPTLSNSHVSLGSGNAPFTGSMTNLSIGTTYYVRAYATNSRGTSYSSTQQTLTTGNGLPTVTTTNVTMSGGKVVSGGNVTSSGGYTVTARGICYGVYPNPDLTAAYTHTTDGTGTGYFTSVIEASEGSQIYVRAYATNANGTAYGEQVILNLDYLRLPTFQFNGHTYKVAPDPGNFMGWGAANAYCENLTAYGYTDWKLPTVEELETMYANRGVIGGFETDNVRNGDTYYFFYWSSTKEINQHYSIEWKSGQRMSWPSLESAGCSDGSYYCYYHVHVRPIRVDN